MKHLKASLNLAGIFSFFSDMGPLNFIFMTEYMISPIYMDNSDCKELCSNNGNTLGKLSSIFTLNIWTPHFRVTVELSGSS